MTQKPLRLLIVVLLLGWAFDFLFWERSAGVNFAIFIMLCLLGGFYLLLAAGLKPAPKGLLLLIPFAFFAAITFVRQEPLTLVLAYAFTLISAGLLAATYLGGRWMEYSLSDYIQKSTLLVANMFTRPSGFFVQVLKERAEQSETNKAMPVWPVLRGLLIALPVVAFLGTLLASADLVFNQKIIDFLALFSFGKIIEYSVRLVNILFCAYLLAGVFLHAESQSNDEKLLGEDRPLVKPFLGITESAIVLSSVAVLFLLFVIIQFRYFFGGEVNIGVEGFTYSQYARRGFNELVMVAFFSLLMILGLSTITQRETGLQRRIYSGLSVAIVALVIVILVSAFQRLLLAIDWHGFSRLRVYPQVFLIWVGILFVAVVVLEIFHRERDFAFAGVLASLGFAISLSLVNVDAAIVRHNVSRAALGRHFNVNYLASLTTDAVPALADEFLGPSLPAGTRYGVGAALLCHLHSNAISGDAYSDWRSYNFSRWEAIKALQAVQDQFQGFSVNEDRKPLRVRTPGNVLYDCPYGLVSRD